MPPIGQIALPCRRLSLPIMGSYRHESGVKWCIRARIGQAHAYSRVGVPGECLRRGVPYNGASKAHEHHSQHPTRTPHHYADGQH